MRYTPVHCAAKPAGAHLHRHPELHLSTVLQGLFDIGHGTVLDSGTTFTYLPTQAFNQLHIHVSDYALSHGLHTTPGPEPQYHDTCFGGAPSFEETDKLGEFFPGLELYFEVSTEGSGSVYTQNHGLIHVTGLQQGSAASQGDLTEVGWMGCWAMRC